MDKPNDQIKKLLERYFNAQTTITEEHELLCYFREAEEIPDEFSDTKMLFIGLDILARGGNYKSKPTKQMV